MYVVISISSLTITFYLAKNCPYFFLIIKQEDNSLIDGGNSLAIVNALGFRIYELGLDGF